MNNPFVGTALRVTPPAAFEVAQLLDRTGDGIATAHDGIVTLLADVYRTGSPNLALELDQDGEVIARQTLTLHRSCGELSGAVEGIPVASPRGIGVLRRKHKARRRHARAERPRQRLIS